MRNFKITVNGKVYDVKVEESDVANNTIPVVASTPANSAVETASAPVAAGEGTSVEAPMPGTILKILVSNGQSVKSGDPLVVLEAMKMENEIASPCDGVVSSICVNTGDTVDAGKVLLTVK